VPNCKTFAWGEGVKVDRGSEGSKGGKEKGNGCAVLLLCKAIKGNNFF